MCNLRSVGCALSSLGFSLVAQSVASTVWADRNGCSVVVMSSGLVRVETLRGVRSVRCANNPPMAVRKCLAAVVGELNGEIK